MKKIIITILLFLPAISNAEMHLEGEIRKIIIHGENNFFIHIGNNTKKILTARAGIIDKCTITIKTGDAPKPIGDNMAKQHALIQCPEFKDIGLRLKQANINHYHILGYWTLK